MSKRKSPRLTDLGCGLAITACQKINQHTFTVHATQDIDKPETIHNFAIFADVLVDAHEEGYNKGVASVALKPMNELQLAAKDASNVMITQAQLLIEENKKLKASIAELEKAHSDSSAAMLHQMWSQKPIARLELRKSKDPSDPNKYFDVVILNRDLSYDGMELFKTGQMCADLSEQLAMHKDGLRWRELLRHVGAETSGPMKNGEFVIRRSNDEYKAHNLMRGGVSGHLTDYIDRMLVQREGK